MSDSLPPKVESVKVTNFPASSAVTGTLTADQGAAGASAWPVSGPITDTQLRASAVPVSGPVTDTQLRASAVPVSGPLTDTQLRASAVPTSSASLPLPSNAAQETGGNLASILSSLVSILANQTNGTELVYDSNTSAMLNRLEQSSIAQRSLQLQELRILASQVGGFIPLPELPAFLGG